jgi:hypothetical protein
MAAGNVVLFSNALLEITKKSFDLSADTIIAALVAAAYTPAPDTHKLWSDVSANELATGGGYTAGGIALTSQTMTLTAALSTFTAANISWTNATLTAKYCVLSRRAGASLVAGDLLLGYVDLNSGGGSLSPVAGTLAVNWNASGILTFVHSP